MPYTYWPRWADAQTYTRFFPCKETSQGIVGKEAGKKQGEGTRRKGIKKTLQTPKAKWSTHINILKRILLRLSAHLTHQLPFCYSFTYSKRKRRELARKETYDTPQHILLTAFLHLASEEQFIEDEIRLLEVKDNV